MVHEESRKALVAEVPGLSGPLLLVSSPKIAYKGIRGNSMRWVSSTENILWWMGWISRILPRTRKIAEIPGMIWMDYSSTNKDLRKSHVRNRSWGQWIKPPRARWKVKRQKRIFIGEGILKKERPLERRGWAKHQKEGAEVAERSRRFLSSSYHFLKMLYLNQILFLYEMTNSTFYINIR